MRRLTTLLSGWGRSITENTTLIRPEFMSDLSQILNDTQSIISRGCGRSYGDMAINPNGLTLLTTRFNRFIAFDEKTSELTCESGITLRDIQRTFLPKGYALITSPGTADVTVGGAIANDVHGKNHDRVGSFGNHVVWIELLLSTGDMIRCSETENNTLFFATIGGLGLTGIITRICLRLQKHPMAVLVKNEMIPDIQTCLAHLKAVRETATYSVAWLDFSSNKYFARGVLSTAEPCSAQKRTRQSARLSVPPLSHLFLNDFTIRLHNQWHYFRESRTEKQSVQSLMQYLYPLDGIQNWNTLYGKRGFYQFQCVIPDDAAEEGIKEITRLIAHSAQKPYLSVLKTFGSEGRGLLSFPLRGFTLAMDFPNKQDTLALLHKLEDITVAHHGRLYFAKDACMRAEHLEKMYPNIDAFRDVLQQYDPAHRFESRLSDRLKI
jgi:decaprenylphospho-beta-D-ribofuranose 2-oxidase